MFKKETAYKLFRTAAMLFFTGVAFAQTVSDDPKAVELLDKAIGKGFENNNISIVFESIALGIENPLTIFSLPAYKENRGGYLYLDGSRSEMQAGAVKYLCDGHIMAAIDEISKTMFLDSVRSQKELARFDIAEQAAHPDPAQPAFDKLFDDTYGEPSVIYAGEELINGKNCHKLKAVYSKDKTMHVFYWINKATGALYLMAEWQNQAYDVYWVKSVGKAPKGYTYGINLPKKEIENFYGYSVIDNRFAATDLKANKSFDNK